MISRRRILQGTGAMMALPLLERFSNKKAMATGASDPKRLVMIHWPNGTMTRASNPTWFSAPDGAAFTSANAPIPLQPFTSNYGDISILKYLTQTALYVNLVNGSGDHQTSHLFTGQSGFTGLKDSFDVAYAKTTPQNRIIYLANTQQTGGGNSGIELSQSGGANVEPEVSPISLWNTYFKNLAASSGTPAAPADVVRNPAILSVPNDALSDLNSKLGKNDQATLASFVTALSELKTNLGNTTQAAGGCVPIADPTAASATANAVSGTDYFTRMLAFNSLIATAFQCDLFRSVSISFGAETGISNYMSYGNGASAASSTNYPSSLVYMSGAPGNIQDHSISHQSDNNENAGGAVAGGVAMNMTRDRLHLYLVCDLINKLKAVTDPSGSKILDNTAIFGAFSTYDGQHDPGDTLGQPAIVAGGKNLGFNPGRSINAAAYDINDVFFTFGGALGMNLTSWYPAAQIALPYGSMPRRTMGSTKVPL